MKTANLLGLAVSVILSSYVLFSGSSYHPLSRNLDSIQSGTTGAIKGYVKDAKTGAPIDTVKITLVYAKNETVKFEIQTDKKGYYYIGGLTPGYYKFTFEKEGFLPASQTWQIKLAETVQADLNLQTLEASPVADSPKAAQKAMAFFKEAKWEEAVKEFSKGISGDPTNPLLYFYRGLSQENRDQVEEALADYQKAIELKPDFVLPYSRSAKIYARQKNHEKANEFYQKAVELGDQDITTLYNHAVVLMNLGKNAEAKVALESLLERDREYADAYYHLGILSIGLGETEKAKESLQKFLQLDPENPNAPLARKILESLG
jgi:tetratricopeptide (TPR) repeat protein